MLEYNAENTANAQIAETVEFNHKNLAVIDRYSSSNSLIEAVGLCIILGF